jgi:uncharacterized heparinase superfamily protein
MRIEFQDELEVNFWMNIYSKTAGGDDIYHDGDPAAETADKAIMSLRFRMPQNHPDATSSDKEEQNVYLNSPRRN